MTKQQRFFTYTSSRGTVYPPKNLSILECELTEVEAQARIDEMNSHKNTRGKFSLVPVKELN